MYGDNLSANPIKSDEINYLNIDANTEYYFADSYTTDTNSKKFTLTGNKVKSTVANWTSSASDKKYSCIRYLQSEDKCDLLIEMIKVNNPTSIQAYFYTYDSTSYENTRTNMVSSNAKTLLENWYETKLEKTNELGINAVNYISNNATFCNDRSLSPQEGNGNGYSAVPTTYYGAYDRNYIKRIASLVCPDVEYDLFSTKRSNGKGNKKLEKPIGLITSDEMIYAGAVINVSIQKFYLYTGELFLTLTPSTSNSSYGTSNIIGLFQNGVLAGGSVGDPFGGLRAVINLNSNVLVKNGNGTMDDPYTVKLAS